LLNARWGGTRRAELETSEEAAYLEAAAPLLRDFALIAFDCGLCLDKSYWLRFSQVRNGSIEIHTGKTKGRRRSVPASQRVLEMIAARRAEIEGDLIFPAPTKTGHIGSDSLRKQHAVALKAAKLDRFVIYSLRHTCLTRWAESPEMDVFTLKKLAGHSRIETTMRYIHMNDARTRKRLEKLWEERRGHKSGHSAKNEERPLPTKGRLNASN
jgi:integrase